jgi:MoaA/NifB/PqqE/SkfB family radical SAM enzyme
MILEIKRYADYAKKSFVHKNRLNFLILYVTSKCNLSCGSCFFHENLNKETDMSLDEYEKIAKSSGQFSILGIAGGEPYLNPDLEKICSIFVEKGKIDTLFIPTNGTMTEIIIEKTEKLLKKFPDISVSINPSLDGMEGYHDENRGLPGTFSKCVGTIGKLTELKKKYKNLQVIVNSVINWDNLEEVEKLMEFLKNYDIDFQAFELMRGNFRDKKLDLPSPDEIKEIHRKILKNRYWYLMKKKDVLKNKLLSKIEEVAVLGALKYGQTFKELALAGKRWPKKCMAGRSIFAVGPDGTFSACEINPPLADLKRYGFNLSKILKDKNVIQKIKNIENRKCDCTHICFIHSAIAASPASIFGIILNYMKARKIIKS